MGLMDINLYFLGNRDYVNGLSIFEEMLKSYLLSCGADVSHISKIKTFKINKFIRNNSWIELYKPAEIRKNPKIRKASARLDLLTDRGEVSILLFEKNDPVKTRLKEYDRGQYLAKLSHFPDDSSIAEIINFTDIFELMRGIIEANFRFVNEKAAQMEKTGSASWVYLSNFDFFEMANAPSKLTACFRLDSTYEAYQKFFIIRSLQIEKFQENIISEICFFV
jgi:hypothetical protein